MTKDSDPEKWIYREHTKVKHILLEKYLAAWIPILGKYNPKICYFDGFAGRGEYIDESTGEVLALGSPIIALRVADKKADYFGKLLCVFIEKNKDNYKNLEEVLEREKSKIKSWEKIEIIKENDEFANVIGQIFDYLEKEGSILVPSFFFVDPFGFSGIPFKIIKKILSNPRTEVFFTFMIRDINRFLKIPKVEEHLDALYPTPEWQEIYKMKDWQERDKALLYLYLKSLHEEAGVKYTWTFRVCMDEKYQTLYYLIHATNNFKGHSIMKSIMHNQSVDGSFAYLGPKDISERSQMRLFNIHDIKQLKRYLLEKFKGKTLTYDEIQEKVCEPWYEEPPYIDKHYREALKELEDEGKITVERVTSKKRGLKGSDRITFLKSNPIQVSLLNVNQSILKIPQIKIHYKEYQLLDGTRKSLVKRVNDGSIISRFDKTPLPKKATDVVCPHFLELKWAYGCPYDCAWCYLKGTFRFRPEGTSPVVKPFKKIEQHVRKFIEEVKIPEILNTGEIADSLLHENNKRPFSKFIIPIFETQKIHKVLFLTKSSNVKNLLEINPHNQAIISFSLNAIPVSERWEKAPHVLKRIEAAKKVFDAGYQVRVRIDPMVPIENWQKHYLELVDIIFENFSPERITLGSLRGLQSTINGCSDKSWVRYLKESSNWGKKVDFKTRYEMYSLLINNLKKRFNFTNIALCKETLAMWKALKMDYRKIRCNCVW
jgi:spore photoproduct lyase